LTVATLRDESKDFCLQRSLPTRKEGDMKQDNKDVATMKLDLSVRPVRSKSEPAVTKDDKKAKVVVVTIQ
jgi:hypothetical protein